MGIVPFMLNKWSDEPSLNTSQNKGLLEKNTFRSNCLHLTVHFTGICETTVHIQYLHNITFGFHTIVVLDMINFK